MKYCFACGKLLPVEDAKFCPECGTNLVGGQAKESQAELIGTTAASAEMESPGAKPAGRLRYELGKKLEENVAMIFQAEGYQTELRKHFTEKGGAEIDILVRMGKRTKAVECKNYDIQRQVGIKEVRDFKAKLDQIGLVAGVFVTTTVYSEDARNYADNYNVELWDKSILLEKFASFLTGRGSVQFAKTIPALRVTNDFPTSSSVTLRNKQPLRLFKSVLIYHPYHLVKFRVRATRKDPTGKLHKVIDEGLVVLDGLDGDVTNREESITKSLTGLLSSKEKRAERKEDKAVARDLLTLRSTNEAVPKNPDYEVKFLDVEVTEEEAKDRAVEYVIEKDTRTVHYQPKSSRDELFGEVRSMKIVPKDREVTLRGQSIAYVPKWDLQFESGEREYQRRVLASSGTILVDELAKCMKCTLLRKDTSAVCDVCGVTLCDKHVYEERGGFLCEDHISTDLREQIKGKGVFSRFKLGRK